MYNSEIYLSENMQNNSDILDLRGFADRVIIILIFSITYIENWSVLYTVHRKFGKLSSICHSLLVQT